MAQSLFLTEYGIAMPRVIIEVEPQSGKILRRFVQPTDWQWDASHEKANWYEQRGHLFLIYMHDGSLIFQMGQQRFDLKQGFTSRHISWVLWRQFRLYQEGKCVYRFTYFAPEMRLGNLFDALFGDADDWDCDTPFEDAHEWLSGRN